MPPLLTALAGLKCLCSLAFLKHIHQMQSTYRGPATNARKQRTSQISSLDKPALTAKKGHA